MYKYEVDNFGWPKKKIAASKPKILFCSKVFFIPNFLTRKIFYCFDVNKKKNLTQWYIDETLANFTLKNFLSIKKFFFPQKYLYLLLRLFEKLFFFKIKTFTKNELLLFGPYSNAYSHQLHEFILRLFHIKYNKKLQKKNILVSSDLKKILNSSVFLYIFKNLKINYYKSNQINIFKNVNYLTHIENRFGNQLLKKNILLLKNECNEFFINKAKKFKNYKYILASRDKAVRRHLLNENILYERLKKYGFKKIFFEDLSFDDQINLSLNVKILVGYHGTSFANGSIFMKKKTKLIEIMHKAYPNNHTKVFADINTINLKRFWCTENKNNLDGVCDVNDIEKYIKDII
jgi:hypothetical protein